MSNPVLTEGNNAIPSDADEAAIYLEKNGFDGLYHAGSGEECACLIDELAPCGEDPSQCSPGYKDDCPGDNKCDFGGACGFHVMGTRPAQPLTEETLKELEELLGKATPGKWIEVYEYGKDTIKDSNVRLYVGGEYHSYQFDKKDSDLVCALRNNAKELLRGYRLGIGKDREK